MWGESEYSRDWKDSGCGRRWQVWFTGVRYIVIIANWLILCYTALYSWYKNETESLVTLVSTQSKVETVLCIIYFQVLCLLLFVLCCRCHDKEGSRSVGGNKGNGSILWYDGAFGCQRSDFRSSPCEIFLWNFGLKYNITISGAWTANRYSDNRQVKHHEDNAKVSIQDIHRYVLAKWLFAGPSSAHVRLDGK